MIEIRSFVKRNLAAQTREQKSHEYVTLPRRMVRQTVCENGSSKPSTGFAQTRQPLAFDFMVKLVAAFGVIGSSEGNRFVHESRILLIRQVAPFDRNHIASSNNWVPVWQNPHDSDLQIRQFSMCNWNSCAGVRSSSGKKPRRSLDGSGEGGVR